MIQRNVRSRLAALSVFFLFALVGPAPTAHAATGDASNPPKDPEATFSGSFLGTNPDGYIGLLANYYQVLDGLITTAQWIDNLVSPQPSLADLLQQMETQIIFQLKAGRDDGLTWAADGYAQRFEDIVLSPNSPLNLPPSQTVEDILSDASVTWDSMASIISGDFGDSPEEAYRMAIPFITLRATYMAMLQYDQAGPATIINRIQMAIQTEYQLVGTTDGDCSILSGVNTEFNSRVFAARYVDAPHTGGYFCDFAPCARSQLDTNEADGYDCFQQPSPPPSPLTLQCQLLFTPDTSVPLTPPVCKTITQEDVSCIQEATDAYRWRFHHDFVTALVRADLSSMLQQLQTLGQASPQVVNTPYCSLPLGLLPFGELCFGTECAVDTYTAFGATQSSTGTLFGSNDFPATWAIDGVTGPTNGSQVTLTNVETNPWWEVDLGFALPIGQIEIWPSQLVQAQGALGIPFVDKVVVELNGTSDWTIPTSNFAVNSFSEQSVPIIVNANGLPGRYVRLQGIGMGALSLAEVIVLPFAQQPTMAFESAASWQVQNGGSASLSTTSSEGAHSLSVSAAPGGWTPIVSQALTSMQIRGVAKTNNLGAMSFALSIPTTQPNPYWIGGAQMYITSPSANVYNAFMGEVELTPLPKGQFTRLGFTIPSNALPAVTLDHDDVTFTIILNVNAGTSGWLVDDLEIGQ